MVRGLWGREVMFRERLFLPDELSHGCLPSSLAQVCRFRWGQVETQMEPLRDFAQERGCSKAGAEGRRVGFRERASSRGCPPSRPRPGGTPAHCCCPGTEPTSPRRRACGSVAPRERRLLAAEWPWQTPAQQLGQHICKGDPRGGLSPRPSARHASARTG